MARDNQSINDQLYRTRTRNAARERPTQEQNRKRQIRSWVILVAVVLAVALGIHFLGSYGKGIHKCVAAFKKAGMTDVSVRVYPLCRHEILNEINKEEIYEDVTEWIQKVM